MKFYKMVSFDELFRILVSEDLLNSVVVASAAEVLIAPPSLMSWTEIGGDMQLFCNVGLTSGCRLFLGNLKSFLLFSKMRDLTYSVMPRTLGFSEVSHPLPDIDKR